MALTELGYHRPTYEEILEDKIQLAKNLFGEDIETNEQTPLGKFIRIGAFDLSKAYEDLENIYYARFPHTASGVSLDRLCAFVGISRNPATRSEYSITVQGEPGAEVEEIIACGSNPEITFHNIEPFVVGEDGTASVVMECTIAGITGNNIVINEIVNPIADIEGIAACLQTEIAEDIESDYDLRRRLDQAQEGVGGSSLRAVRAAVLKVPTVKSVSIIENVTNSDDEAGRPPHSFETYVYGGEDSADEIAQAIFDVKPLGIQTVGSAEVTITDVSGDDHIIKYSPATTINILTRLSIRVNEDFPADGIAQIQANVADRINELDLGEALILSRLYGCAYRVGGVSEVTVLEASTDGGSTYSPDNILVTENNVAISSGVTVEVVS